MAQEIKNKVVVITGASSGNGAATARQMAHMVENSGAANIRFTSSELAELNGEVRAIEVRGARLPDQVLVFSGVEAPPKK